MTIIYWLIPLSLILGAAAIGAFFWAVRSGQFDDMHTPALKILDDDPAELEAPKPDAASHTNVTKNPQETKRDK